MAININACAHIAAELRRHLEAADEEIIRLRERLQKTPVACPLCAHRTQREAAIVSAEHHRAVAAESKLSGVRAELEACNEQVGIEWCLFSVKFNFFHVLYCYLFHSWIIIVRRFCSMRNKPTP